MADKMKQLARRHHEIGLRKYPAPEEFVVPAGYQSRHGRLRLVSWWRLLPYGAWTEPNGSIVIFDRNYCPIARKNSKEVIEAVHPLERIVWVHQAWFYKEVTSPYISSRTLPFILEIIRDLGMQDEIRRRWVLSEYGFVPHEEWGMKWSSGCE